MGQLCLTYAGMRETTFFLIIDNENHAPLKKKKKKMENKFLEYLISRCFFIFNSVELTF